MSLFWVLILTIGILLVLISPFTTTGILIFILSFVGYSMIGIGTLGICDAFDRHQ